ncbi:MAG: hypothetical protein K2M34_03930 [Alphaproteobacteria bacterium]|nr:hypothetical protein [Alphaproteobacteria bacterium]
METFIIILVILVMTLLCGISLAVEAKTKAKSVTQSEEETDTSPYDNFDIDEMCDNLEQHDRTQLDLLSAFAKNVAKHNNSTADNLQALEIFGIPCIEQAINTKYPDMPQNTKQDIKISFFNKCASNSRDAGHLDILKLAIKNLIGLDFINKGHIKIDKSNIKEMISIGMMVTDLSKNITKFYTSNISYVREIIETFGTEQDLQNFDTWVERHEETGKWDWKFFSTTNLGGIFWTGNEILKNKHDARFRLEQIKQTIRTNNPIDKSISKALRLGKQTGLVIAYSKFMKYVFWFCITILILTLIILAD